MGRGDSAADLLLGRRREASHVNGELIALKSKLARSIQKREEPSAQVEKELRKLLLADKREREVEDMWVEARIRHHQDLWEEYGQLEEELQILLPLFRDTWLSALQHKQEQLLPENWEEALVESGVGGAYLASALDYHIQEVSAYLYQESSSQGLDAASASLTSMKTILHLPEDNPVRRRVLLEMPFKVLDAPYTSSLSATPIPTWSHPSAAVHSFTSYMSVLLDDMCVVENVNSLMAHKETLWHMTTEEQIPRLFEEQLLAAEDPHVVECRLKLQTAAFNDLVQAVVQDEDFKSFTSQAETESILKDHLTAVKKGASQTERREVLASHLAAVREGLGPEKRRAILKAGSPFALRE